jgi:hypothetical protein
MPLRLSVDQIDVYMLTVYPQILSAVKQKWADDPIAAKPWGWYADRRKKEITC